MPRTPLQLSPDEVMYYRSYPDDVRIETTYGEFVDRSRRWVRHHPEAYVMADGTLHHATCAEVVDLTVLDWLIGAHKDPRLLIRRALVEWEGYRRCGDCRPEALDDC